MNDLFILKFDNGKIAIFDADDVKILNRVKALYCVNNRNNEWRVVFYWPAKFGGTPPITRLLLSEGSLRIKIDHINGHTLDNTRRNLRRATHIQNSRNRRQTKTNSNQSKYKGVKLTQNSKNGKLTTYSRYISRIVLGGRLKHIGCFSTQEKAALAYNHEALINFGKFASLNKIDWSQCPEQAKEKQSIVYIH